MDNTTNDLFGSPGKRVPLRVINGQPATEEDLASLMTATTAIRAVGVAQAGPVRRQLAQLGIPVVALGGAAGGVFLVRKADVRSAKERHEAEQARKAEREAAREAKRTVAEPVVPVEAASQVVPEAMLVELREHMSRMESKLDRLLAVWGAE